ncbi:related to ERG6-Delta(24)-sterol C-methyltransferase [Ustilago bromivora]|uniref:Related to ERG6 - Delta(24)-sterol C-methyltransferase n=1 Tax=Ustilago bromivora TaxID=307758 RepID=A0A1K0GS53_9BASI|nr:related to ERG6-Delta(24)-sterol C-methyltransferase [Ustilago bromivora]SYW79853.1 related to ERG6 - Delta(24)-sterol C-methyltransferase [Ustilago bromivora]
MTSQKYHRSEDATVYRQNASFVYSSAYTAPVLQLLDPQPGDKILDYGCGSGEITLDLATIVGPDGEVTGLDASDDMIIKACNLHASHPTLQPNAPLQFINQDGHDKIPLEHLGVYDKVFSNAALHWMKRDPSLVLSRIHSAIKPNGIFAAELGGFLNCVGIRSQLHLALKRRSVDPEKYDPWFFPSPDQYSALLKEAGFEVESCELVPRITPLPKESGLRGWLRTFAGPFLNAIEGEEEREKVVGEVEEAVRCDCFDANSGVWSVMYVRLRVKARKLPQP